MKLFSSFIVLMLLTGCGGFRGGVKSVPYIGEAAVQEKVSSLSGLYEIALPDFSLWLSLNNDLQMYQYEVMLFVIPTYFNFWNEFRNRGGEALELTLQVVARDFTVSLNPHELLLTIDETEVHPSGVWVINYERERQVFGAYVKARREASEDRPPAVPRASEWRDAVSGPVTVRANEQSPRLIVTFPVGLISPERSLTLRINQAALNSKHSGVLVIHFKPVSWSEGYS